jgi:hypothetical protein
VAQAAPIETPAEMPQLYAAVPAPKMVTVKLERNYVPLGELDAEGKPTGVPNHVVTGYWQDEIKRKNPMGQEVIIQPLAFIENQPKPPPQPGVGQADKLWAGTVVKLPVEEAKTLRAKGNASVEID